MKPEMPPSEVLAVAAAHLEYGPGWCQGAYEFQGEVCAAGALGLATGDETRALATEARSILFKTIAERISAVGVTTWNDRPGQTKANVIRTLKRAARKAAAEGR